MADVVEKLKLAVGLAIRARRNIDRACELAGCEPPSREQLRLLNPAFREFEAAAPAGWVGLVELAAMGDVEALEQLDALGEREGGGQPVH